MIGIGSTPTKTATSGTCSIHLCNSSAISVRDAHAPGFYLHLEPGQVFVGLGIWHPDGPTLQRIRQHLVAHPVAWQKARDNGPLNARFEHGGERLKRPPRGFDGDHPLIEDLKRKDFIVSTRLDQRDVLAADFLDRFTADCRIGAPWLRFLCQAVDVPF